MTIWKYVIQTTDYQQIPMPMGAEILAVQVQRGEVCLWVRVNPNHPKEPRGIIIHGTGHELSAVGVLGRHIGTYQLMGGDLVFHVFEARQ